MKQYLLVFISLLTLNVNGQNSFITDSIDIYIQREMQRWQVPGLSVAIVKDGKVIVSKGYGYTDINKTKTVDEYSLFQIASNSKAFTGTSIALLDYQKKLKLDEKVTYYLPYFKLYDSNATSLCTVRDILCHRLGMETFQGDFVNWNSTLTRKEIIEKMAVVKPIYPFRYIWGYCNAGFISAGEIVKTVTDTTWDNYIKAHFFDKLNMKHTNSSNTLLETDANACKPYTLVKNKLVELPFANIDNMGGAACINSCVSDMSHWLMMLLDSGKYEGKSILPYEVIAETQKSQMLIGDVHSRYFKTKMFSTYGLGWEMYDYNNTRVVEHSGGANGFVTQTLMIPEIKLGILVYTNSDANSLYNALAMQIAEAYLNMPYRNISEYYFNRTMMRQEADENKMALYQSLVAKKDKPSFDWNSLKGKYHNDTYGDIEIVENSKQMEIHFSHHPNNIGKLEFMDTNRLLCTYSDVTCGIEVTPVEIKNNKVSLITIKVNDFIDYLSYDFVKIN